MKDEIQIYCKKNGWMVLLGATRLFTKGKWYKARPYKNGYFILDDHEKEIFVCNDDIVHFFDLSPKTQIKAYDRAMSII